jgi:hypothetical protein
VINHVDEDAWELLNVRGLRADIDIDQRNQESL